MNKEMTENLRVRSEFFESQYSESLRLRREDETRIAIVFRILAEHFAKAKDKNGLKLLSNLLDATFISYVGEYFAVGEYIADLKQELSDGKNLSSNEWLDNSIDDKELYDKIYHEIKSKLKP